MIHRAVPTYPPEIQVPANCSILLNCFGQGIDTKYCQKRDNKWESLGVQITLTCGPGISGSLNFTGINMALYNVTCGSVKADESTDIRYSPDPSLPIDSADYRRSVVPLTGQGCLEKTMFVTRTNVSRLNITGVSEGEGCDRPGAIERIPYNGTYDFLAC